MCTILWGYDGPQLTLLILEGVSHSMRIPGQAEVQSPGNVHEANQPPTYPQQL